MSRYLLILTLLVVGFRNSHSLPDNPVYGYRGEERDALFALRDSLNSTFLKKNWTGLMCYMNDPPKWYGIQCRNGRVTGIVLVSMGLSGSIRADAFANLTQLSILSFRNNSISGPLMDFSKTRKLSFVDLSVNRFDGRVHPSLTELPNLTSLQLNDNHITGHLPPFGQSSLRLFNVSYNDLTGTVPNTTVLQSFGFRSYLGNPKLCGPPTPTPCRVGGNVQSPDPPQSGLDSDRKHKKLNSTTIFIIVDVALLLLILLIVFFFCYKRRSRKLKNPASIKVATESIQTRDSRTPELKINDKLIFIDGEVQFELGDLLKASAEGIGEGNFGNNYKAQLEDGQAFVVKRLRDLKPMSVQEFEKQVRFIADVRHPNLLPLIAFYSSRDEKLIIHKHIAGGNLFNRIQGRRSKNRVPFRWSSRLEVARGVARAVEHLHHNTKSPQATVPHGNLKTANIILDADDAPLVTDYGLTALISFPIASQRLVAYKSPEYQSAKKVTKKSDVWCLGIVLLELLTGRVSIHSAAMGANGVDLCSWVHRAVREEWTAEIFDAEIAAQRSATQGMLRVLRLAMRCCEKAPEKRPEIEEVVRELEGLTTAVEEEEDEEEESDDVSGADSELSYSTSASGRDM
uniref:Protein kinase domain-containing protein n=1 Tax=Kalanchoe fedtschenkoi TaxID=63787 RepID=A0A7N0TW22_KALFE